jgi:phage shock protein A
MDELQATGTFDDALSDKDEIDQELQQGRADREVESELDTLKTEMGKAEADGNGGGGGGSSGGGDDVSLDDLDSGTDEEVEAELAELKDDESTDSSN